MSTAWTFHEGCGLSVISLFKCYIVMYTDFDFHILSYFHRWHCSHCISLRCRVYVTVRHPSVRLSVRLSHHSPSPLSPALRCRGFAAVRPAGRRCRSIAEQPGLSSSGPAARRSAANASSVTLTADVGSWIQTCSIAVSRLSLNEYVTLRVGSERDDFASDYRGAKDQLTAHSWNGSAGESSCWRLRGSAARYLPGEPRPALERARVLRQG